MLSNTLFFFEKNVSKDMNAFNYRIKQLNGFVYSYKASPWEMKVSRICLTTTKRTSNMTKIKN